MLRQVSVGAAASLGNIVIHAGVMVVLVRLVALAHAKETLRPWLNLIAVMVATVAILMVAHICEVIVWALTYALIGAVPLGGDHVYFAFVNYTTLGYGDIVPEKRWQLLGPMTAMNGVLLFGWSTAVMFEMLRRTVRRKAMMPPTID
jgi:hypothetical protein